VVATARDFRIFFIAFFCFPVSFFCSLFYYGGVLSLSSALFWYIWSVFVYSPRVFLNPEQAMYNAEKRGKRQVLVRPVSKVVIKFLQVMQKHGTFTFSFNTLSARSS